MKKRLLAILMVLTLVVCVFQVNAFALTDGYTDASKRNDDGNWVIKVNGVTYNVTYGTVIRQGNTTYNRDVYVAQIALNKINYLYSGAGCSVGSADGIFGSGTYTGVVAFQKYWNHKWGYSSYYAIDTDGIIGNCTWACISATST